MERLDKLLLGRYPDFSRSRIEGLVKAGYVTVNGAVAGKAGQKVSETDEIEVEIPPPVPAVPEPEDIPLDVVWEDGDMLVVNKAPGMVVHPAPGHFAGTLVNALLHRCPDLAGEAGCILGSGRPPGEGNGKPVQYSCLENPMNRGVWRL